MRILILGTNGMCHGCLDYFTVLIMREFESVGCECVLLDFIPTPDSVRGRADMLLGFNLDLSLMDEHGNYLYDLMEIPIVDFIVDHPLKHRKSLELNLQNFYVVCMDEEHREFIRKFYHGVKETAYGYLVSKMVNDDILPIKDRLYEVAYICGYIKEDMFLNHIRYSFNEDEKRLIFDCIDELEANYSVSTSAVICKRIEQKYGLPQGDFSEEIYKELVSCWYSVDNYIRMKSRRLIAQALNSHEIPMIVCGDSWDEVNFSNRNIIKCLPELSYEEFLDFTRKSRIGVNVFSMFKEGYNDRVFSVMETNTVLATDETTGMRKIFQDGKDCIYYRLDDLDSFAERIGELLSNYDEMQMIADNGKRLTEFNFSMTKTILNVLEMVFGR